MVEPISTPLTVQERTFSPARHLIISFTLEPALQEKALCPPSPEETEAARGEPPRVRDSAPPTTHPEPSDHREQSTRQVSRFSGRPSLQTWGLHRNPAEKRAAGEGEARWVPTGRQRVNWNRAPPPGGSSLHQGVWFGEPSNIRTPTPQLPPGNLHSLCGVSAWHLRRTSVSPSVT